MALTRLGEGLFANNCAVCHGRAATGGSGPTLNSRQFLTSTSNEQMRLLIAGGVSGSSMPAWSLDFGGPLTDAAPLCARCRNSDEHRPR